jgi:D-alanyl-D-alanine carboxypeptidase/D-alanyl-D-alanine-endopeptidase (penicillin-binding protein 4)
MLWLCPTQERWMALRRTILLMAAMAVALTIAVLCGCQSDKQGGSNSSKKGGSNSSKNTAQAQTVEQTQQTQGGELSPKVTKIMDSSIYRYGEWGLLEVDPSDGHTVHALGPTDRMYIPGSSTKLFTVSAALDDLGFDHHSKTPVYAQGGVKNGTLSGNLVLVASGDLTMGGRTAPNGTVSYTPVDHTYANSVPGATLTPENPLAGLNEIAKQVRKSGITHVDGNVIIDDRLFDLAPKGPSVDALSFNAPNLDPWPRPITINDNLIDVQVKPGKVGEKPKVVLWRPKVAPYHLQMRAKTVPAGKPTTLNVSPQTDGPVVVSGNIAADSGKQLRVAAVDDPSAFARTALIEALGRAGVSVGASPTSKNPSSKLPKKGSYSPKDEVAAYVSPPYSQYAKLILKVSHNYGANLDLCLMAVKAGSTDCNDAFPVMKSFLKKAGVDVDQVALADGRGGNPVDQFSPQAVIDILGYWLKQPQAKTFREMLPVLGVNGSIANVCKDCPAKGKVFAKTGTVGNPDLLNERIIEAESLGGYLEVEPGRFHTFYVVVNGAIAPNIEGAVKVFDDLADIGALLQKDASQQGGASQGDKQ